MSPRSTYNFLTGSARRRRLRCLDGGSKRVAEKLAVAFGPFVGERRSSTRLLESQGFRFAWLSAPPNKVLGPVAVVVQTSHIQHAIALRGAHDYRRGNGGGTWDRLSCPILRGHQHQ